MEREEAGGGGEGVWAALPCEAIPATGSLYPLLTEAPHKGLKQKRDMAG